MGVGLNAWSRIRSINTNYPKRELFSGFPGHWVRSVRQDVLTGIGNRTTHARMSAQSKDISIPVFGEHYRATLQLFLCLHRTEPRQFRSQTSSWKINTSHPANFQFRGQSRHGQHRAVCVCVPSPLSTLNDN